MNAEAQLEPAKIDYIILISTAFGRIITRRRRHGLS